MARLRSKHKDVIKRGLAFAGTPTFFVPNLANDTGILAMDVFAALTARVAAWDIALTGSIGNSSSLFAATSVLTGSTNVSLPALATNEKQFACGMEVYPIRTGNSTASTCSSVTALSMLGAGIVQQPNAPASLANDGSVNTISGPTLTAMGTEIIAGIEQGAADFNLIIRCRSKGRSTGGAGKDYIVDFQLQTSPLGHPLDPSGDSVPVEVGVVSVQIPDWRNGGTNEFEIALYADTLPGNVDEVWLAVSNDGGGGVDYGGVGITGTANIVMTPTATYHYTDSSGVPVWDDGANLLVSRGDLAAGEP